MVRPKKSLGQHFLVDQAIISQIIDALEPSAGMMVVEIGPGGGELTLPLVNSGATVVGIELDRRLAPELARQMEGRANFRMLEADILAVDPDEENLGRFRLVGNLPYNITTPVLEWLYRHQERIDRAVLMMQKEVAERAVGTRGKARSTLSVIASLYYDREIVCIVPPESYRPPPGVESAVVRFDRHGREYGLDNVPRFEKFVRACFKKKRKSLLNNLNSAYPLPRPELQELIESRFSSDTVRAEQLTLEQFIDLWKTIRPRL
jgi:16S rRNA (adenine1518-N6/adenine1519-N6)-dimethyltransferase